MSGQGKASAVKCEMCSKTIAAQASHYVIERDNGTWHMWCYVCAATVKAHRKLAPTCPDQDRCDIWFPHPGYQLVICTTRGVYRRYAAEREEAEAQRLSRVSAASLPPEVPAGAVAVTGSPAEGTR